MYRDSLRHAPPSGSPNSDLPQGRPWSCSHLHVRPRARTRSVHFMSGPLEAHTVKRRGGARRTKRTHRRAPSLVAEQRLHGVMTPCLLHQDRARPYPSERSRLMSTQHTVVRHALAHRQDTRGFTGNIDHAIGLNRERSTSAVPTRTRYLRQRVEPVLTCNDECIRPLRPVPTTSRCHTRGEPRAASAASEALSCSRSAASPPRTRST